MYVGVFSTAIGIVFILTACLIFWATRSDKDISFLSRLSTALTKTIDKDKLINIILVIIAILLTLSLSSTHNAQAATENITIIDPLNDPNNDPITSDFSITIHVTDPNTQNVQAKIIGQTFTSLSQINSLDWQGVINISGVQSGNYQLTARYYNNTGAYFYVQQTTPIKIQKPDPPPTPTPTPTQYGSILLTITDSNNQPISGAKVIPNGNTTDSNGNILINQPLNQYINFTISKTGYNTTYYQTTLTSNQTVSLFFVIHKVNGDVSQFDVTGYEGMEAGRGVFVSVKDKFTGAKVENAQVIIYDGATVKSNPGQTINGRLFVSAPADAKQGQYLIEITKPGYEDFTDTFTIFVPQIAPTPPPTPTPAPSPTPTPTPDKKYWSDSMQMMTDDEHNKWLSDTNLRSLGMNNGSTSQNQQREESTFPWTLFIIGIFITVSTTYRLKPEWFHKKQEIKEVNAANAEEMVKAINNGSVDDVPPVSESIELTCPFCNIWKTTVNKDTSPELREQLLNEHLIKIHEEELENIQKPKPKPIPTTAIKKPVLLEEEMIFDIQAIKENKTYRPEAGAIMTDEGFDKWKAAKESEEVEAETERIKNNGNGDGKKKRSKCQYCSKRTPPKNLPAHELNCELNPANQSFEEKTREE